LERKFKTWNVKSAMTAKQRTAPQMLRVITSIFCRIGRARKNFMYEKHIGIIKVEV
jgi:hypothetical protein